MKMAKSYKKKANDIDTFSSPFQDDESDSSESLDMEEELKDSPKNTEETKIHVPNKHLLELKETLGT